MKSQALCQANIDYEETLDRLKANSTIGRLRLGGGRPPAECHIILDKIKGLEETTILISTRGKIQISYIGCQALYESLNFLKENLVPKAGEDLNLRLLRIPLFHSELYLRSSHAFQKAVQEAYIEVINPGLSTVERGRKLMELVHMLLQAQNRLTLMVIKEAIQEDDEEKMLCNLFRGLEFFTTDVIGDVAGICWLNRDIAADVLKAMLPKGEG
jgi:hypothetical protein